MELTCPECGAKVTAYSYAPPSYWEIESHDKPPVYQDIPNVGHIIIDVACPASKATVEVGT